MNPITLRLTTELLDELDEEAEEYGFSNRSEYIRHLLQNRDTTEHPLVDDSASERQSISNFMETVDELSAAVADIDDRVEALETQVQRLESGAESDTPSTTDEVNPLEELDEWLEEQGPESDNVRTVIRAAASLLISDGPLEAGELKEELYGEYSDLYESPETLWGSTISRVYEEAPGFSKVGYGTYDFE